MANIAYFEPVYGASGDMILAAFMDAGLPVSLLTGVFSELLPHRFSLNTKKVIKSGISATQADIKIHKETQFRGVNEIRKLLYGSGLKKEIIENSFGVINKLAEVEAKIHNIPVESVHFHEIGAVDTIIDVVGYFLALEHFKISKVYVSKIPLGHGEVETSHGTMPVPAFATLELLKGFPVFGVNIASENITPTAAAIFSKTATFSLFPEVIMERCGYGAGNKEFGSYRNLLRLTIGRDIEDIKGEQVVVMEFSVDDMSHELLGNLMEKVLSCGAKDCFFTPIMAKKGRPAILITVLTSLEEKEKICDIIFSETTTIGLRYRVENRVVLVREEMMVKTSLGTVRVKKTFYKGNQSLKPEFEDMKRLSLEKNMPLKQVYSIILREIG